MIRRLGLFSVAAGLALTACRTHAPGGAPASGADAPPAPGGVVHLTPAQAGAIGVTYAVVQAGPLTRSTRSVGRVVTPESGLADVTAKVDGYVERLFIATTGAPVHRGDPLLTIYSPMLVAAEQELLTAARLAASVDSMEPAAVANAQSLLTAARHRLSYWDVSADQIARIERTGAVTKTLTLAAPVTGVVIEKSVVAGQSISAGMTLYRLADLSFVWLEGDLFEQDLAQVRVGAPARVEFAAYPGRSWAGRVTFVAPVVDAMSRTATVRVALDNRDGLLKPGMYGTLFVLTQLDTKVLHVPAEAVVMTGERNLVYVVRADGGLEPREVVLGIRTDDDVQILSGVRAGDRIVASANFLVDAESRLVTDGSSMVGMPGMDAPAPKAAHP